MAGNDEALINEIGPRYSLCLNYYYYYYLFIYFRVSELLNGKGGGRKGRFQGKGSNMAGRLQVETFLRERVATKIIEI